MILPTFLSIISFLFVAVAVVVLAKDRGGSGGGGDPYGVAIADGDGVYENDLDNIVGAAAAAAASSSSSSSSSQKREERKDNEEDEQESSTGNVADLLKQEGGGGGERLLARRRKAQPCSRCDQLVRERRQCRRGCGNTNCKKNCNRQYTSEIDRCRNNPPCTTSTGRGNRRGRKKPGAACRDDGECRDGACAKFEYEPSSDKRCCVGGKKVFDTDGTRYCGNKGGGAKCFTDSMCKSGTCNASGTCRCGRNKDCASNICVNGTCKNRKQPRLAACDDDSDCGNNACAHRHYEPRSSLICCPTGQVFFDQFGFTVCGGQPDNKRCFGQIICRSSRCEKGRCRP